MALDHGAVRSAGGHRPRDLPPAAHPGLSQRAHRLIVAREPMVIRTPGALPRGRSDAHRRRQAGFAPDGERNRRSTGEYRRPSEPWSSSISLYVGGMGPVAPDLV